MLAHRTDSNDTVARTLATTTGLEVSLETMDGSDDGDSLEERVLIM